MQFRGLCLLMLENAFFLSNEKAGGCTKAVLYFQKESSYRALGMQWGHLPTSPPSRAHAMAPHSCKSRSCKLRPLSHLLLPSSKKKGSEQPLWREAQLPHTTRLSLCPQMALEPCGEAFGHTATLMCTSHSPWPAPV